MKISTRKRESGSTLVIVVLFMGLLVGLAVLFLLRALTAVQLSNSSVAEEKATNLATGASDTIIGDLRQEIVDGSTGVGGVGLKTTYPGFGGQTFTVYQPKPSTGPGALSTAVPAIVGFTPAITNGVETDGLANLLKISKNGVAFYNDPTNLNTNYSESGVNRASAVSTSSPALDGSVITPARWNSHYLIQRPIANQGKNLNSTPVSNFPQPDWVIVTRSGAQTPYTVANLPQLSDSTNGQYAIGRYSYAIYNEGGLLDMNAAGYPSYPTQLTYQFGQKTSQAFADLTQLSIPPSTTALLTQQQVDQIVGWRNAYTAQLPAGMQFGSISFGASNATSWANNFAIYNNCQTNTILPSFGLKNGFMSVNGPAGPTSALTDQMFVSRSQLISLIESLGIGPDVLQYMGTFSRSVEQPSYAPNPFRPLIGGVQTGGLSFATGAPPLVAAHLASPDETTYQGNNDAQGGDLLINPAFLSIRVQSSGSAVAFTRFNGQPAIAGEPLVLYRFPLSNLAMVAYNATNKSLPTGFTSTASDPDPIYDHFGLQRSSAGNPWVYNHGSNKIYSLEQVDALNPPREPDFAELLKAAITVGALAKGNPNINATNSDNYQYGIDTVTDYQVLQIMANLIDQQDADSYPTCIQINSGITGSTILQGVEDLPYFYRFHNLSVVDRVPSPLLSNTSSNGLSLYGGAAVIGTGSNVKIYPSTTISRSVSPDSQWSFPAGVQSTPVGTSFPVSIPSVTNPYPWLIGPAQYVPTGQTAITDPGEVTYMFVPDLWNPHDPTTAAQNQALRPTKFRIFAQTAEPYTPASTPLLPWQIGCLNFFTPFPGTTSDNPKNDPTYILPKTNASQTVYYWPISPCVAFSQSNTEMDFSDNNGALFREPTLLWNKNPTGLNLTPKGTDGMGNSTVGPVTDINTNVVYYGMIVGKAPILTSFHLTSNPIQSVDGAAGSKDGQYVIQASSMTYSYYSAPKNKCYQQISFILQYQDPFGNWITYDTKFPSLSNLSTPNMIVNKSDYGDGTTYAYDNPFDCKQLYLQACGIDPRTARWGMGTAQSTGQKTTSSSSSSSSNISCLLEPTANSAGGSVVSNSAAKNQQMPATMWSVFETARPRADRCNDMGLTPGMGNNLQMRLFAGPATTASAFTSHWFSGLLDQNDPSIPAPSESTSGFYSTLYFEDPDGVARRAMGAYAKLPTQVASPGTVGANSTSPYKLLSDPSSSDLAQPITANNPRIGLPEATASTFDDNATATPTQQAQSRPILLNRPFTSVSEMSYAFSGTPWKNIDFFTPESAYSALLDVFCVGQPPTTGIVAGKVDLNTRQSPVLQALLAGTNRDEWNNLPSPPTYALPPITSTEAGLIAQRLVAYTTDKANLWRGPLSNVSDLVGRYIINMPSNPAVLTPGASPDWYTYNEPATTMAPSGGYAPATPPINLTYAGFTGLLDSTVYTFTKNNSNIVAPCVQRFKEAGLRPLADCGQTRVWNLLIDVIAQSGKYPKSATTLSQFAVDGEKRMWIHVAIDRQTGEVIDRQTEVVNY